MTSLFIDDELLNRVLEMPTTEAWYRVVWRMITSRGLRWEYFT